MNGNGNLAAARKAKRDEFYTRYEDVEREMDAYRDVLSHLTPVGV